MKTSSLLLSGIIIASTCLIGCEQESANNNTGTFKTRMTDAPGDYKELVVQIDGVEAYHETAGWVALSTETQMVSVLELTNGIETVIAHNTEVQAGVYSKIKLIFGDSNNLTFSQNSESSSPNLSTSTESTQKLSFNSSNEVIVEIDEEITVGGEASVLLDFQVVQSIIKASDDYILDPTVTYIEDESTGVQGSVEGEAHASVMLTNGNDTISTYTNANGEFLIRGASTGWYELVVEPAKDATSNSETQAHSVSETVVVVQGQINTIGEIKF